jgi:hypothetical protein
MWKKIVVPYHFIDCFSIRQKLIFAGFTPPSRVVSCIVEPLPSMLSDGATFD